MVRRRVDLCQVERASLIEVVSRRAARSRFLSLISPLQHRLVCLAHDLRRRETALQVRHHLPLAIRDGFGGIQHAIDIAGFDEHDGASVSDDVVAVREVTLRAKTVNP